MIQHEFLVGGKLSFDHLLGRPFDPPKFDCYSFARDFYKDTCRIELSNYARPNDWWIDTEFDLYKDNFQNEGFVAVDINHFSQLRPLDAFLIALPDPRNLKRVVTNHCAMYLGDGLIAHHMYGKLSKVDTYRNAYRHFTTAVIRHKDIPDLVNHIPTKLDMLDYLLPHKRALIMGALNDKKQT